MYSRDFQTANHYKSKTINILRGEVLCLERKYSPNSRNLAQSEKETVVIKILLYGPNIIYQEYN